MTGRLAGDQTAFTMTTYADLGMYGADGFTTTRKRDIPAIEPALNHTTIGRLAATIDDYEIIIHPGDFAYADDWIIDLTNFFDGKKAYTAIIERFYAQLAPISARIPYMVSPGDQVHDRPVPRRPAQFQRLLQPFPRHDADCIRAFGWKRHCGCRA